MPPRLMLLAALGAIGCKGSSPEQTTTGSALRFVPASAALAIDLDLARARRWSSWTKVSSAAFRPIADPLEAVQKACGLDLVGEAKSLVFASVGETTTLVLAGLPKDKTAACPAKLGTTVPGLAITPDGTRFGISVAGQSLASGALLPTGELVIVARDGHGIDPAAWRTEVESGAGTAPAWWSTLDHAQPFAIRTHTPERTVVGSADLAEPLVLRAAVESPTAELATADAGRAKAIVDFLTKAEAGTGRLEPKGTTLYADFTATGPQIDKLVTAALSTLGTEGRPAEAPPETDTSPIACGELAAAVGMYLTTNLELMGPDQRAKTEPMFAKLQAPLQKAYVETCTAGAWAPAAIHCHVNNGRNVPRFEKCRLMLTAEQRTSFDGAVKAALATP